MRDRDAALAPPPPGRLQRLLTATHYFESHRGGVELVAGRLAREFAAAGVEVTWMAGDASPPPAPEPRLEVVPLRVWNLAERRLGIPFPIPGLSALARIGKAVRESDAVLLHDSLYPTNIAAFLFARWHGRPVAVVQHIGEVPYRNPLLRGLMVLANRLVARPLLGTCDQVSFISAVTANHFESVRFRRPPALVFNGVDTEVFTPARDAEAKAAIRTRLGLAKRGSVALFVGRFVEKKGLAYLHAAARARPDICWVFAGWGPVDPAAWGLANVRVFKDLDHAQLADLYRAADIMVLPSAGEGFPLVVQEALACGLPVVCGAETGEADPAAAPHLIGLELHPDDPVATGAALCAAVERGLAQPDGGVERARFAAARYAWSSAAARHLELLSAAVGARRSLSAGPQQG